MWHTLLHALIESLKTLPILFLAYVLIEFIEHKTSRSLENSKFLKGKYAPIVGASVGLVPQCGFSVLASDLYTKKQISLATLLAMFIATSDEAVPILLSYPDQYVNLLIILGIKFLMALVVGYATMLIFKIAKRKQVVVSAVTETDEIHKGCCGHDIEDHDHEKRKFWSFIKHPLLHCLKIFGFILLVNIAFGLIIHYVGETRITSALNSAKYLQPIIAGLIGLIPNCASSAIIANLFAMGGLSIGACVAGLMANAGIGLAVLVKQNPNRKHTFFIILSLYLVSVVTGLILTLIF